MSSRIVLAVLAIVLAGCGTPAVESLPPIVRAARDGDIERLDRLIGDGADINAHAGVNGWTPLMHAIHRNQLRSVRSLLEHGARTDERGNGRTTALILASGYGYAEMVRILLAAGADPRARTAAGETALVAAVGGTADIDRFTVGKCQTEAVRLLRFAAPDVIVPAPARIAARLGGCSEVLDLLAPR